MTAQNYFQAPAYTMMGLSGKNDFSHDQNFSHLAAILLLPNVTSKMLNELAGIRMAAIKGDSTPCTA